MAEDTKNRVTRKLQSNERRVKYAKLFAGLSLCVAIIVAISLHLTGIAMVREETILTCPVAGVVAHTHDASCYDSNGELVCPLPELEEHVHTDECYTDVRVLTCGITGTHEHRHTDECYSPVLELTCEIPESDEHQHTDACYTPKRELTCGKEEITETHVHGPGCFTTVVVDDGDLGEAFFGFGDSDGNEGDSSEDESVEDDSGMVSDETVGDVSPEENEEIEMPAQTFEEELREVDENGVERTALRVIVEAPEGALPKGTTMRVERVNRSDVADVVGDAVKEKTDGRLTEMVAVDITFINEYGEEIEPASEITVWMTSDLIAQKDDTYVVHVDDEGKSEVVDSQVGNNNEVVFDSDQFSIYVLAGTTLEDVVLDSSGNRYRITVTCGVDSDIPEDATLDVHEIVQEDGAVDGATEYDHLVAEAEKELGLLPGQVSYARFFEINILGREGDKLQPAEGSTVDVSIALDDIANGTIDAAESQVVHFGDEVEVVDASPEGDAVTFKATGFSVYAIVEAKDPVSGNEEFIQSLDQLVNMADYGFYISYNSEFYFTDTEFKSGDSKGIKKDNRKPDATDAGTGVACLYYLEASENNDNQYRIYRLDNNGDKRYIKQTGEKLEFTETTNDGTPVNIEHDDEFNNIFRISSDGYYWCIQSGKTPTGFIAKNDASNPNNALQFSYIVKDEESYNLDGKELGIAYRLETINAAGLTANAKTVSNKRRLGAQKMRIQSDVVDRDGLFLVTPGSNPGEGDDIEMWTFSWLGGPNGDKYQLCTERDGKKLYLAINHDEVYLTDLTDKSDEVYTRIKVTPGTNDHEGTYHLTVNGYALRLVDGSKDKGFAATKDNKADTWLCLTSSVDGLKNEDLVTYKARKASTAAKAADDNEEQGVKNGDTIVIYTRVWDDEEKEYKYYVLDATDGASINLVECYASGDVIQWVGNKTKSAQWEFIEYQSDGSRNHYYDLRSIRQDNEDGDGETSLYIAPQLKNNQVVSSQKIGVNLEGRRYNDDYTTIIAWDDPYYAYAGLKVEDGELVSCPLGEAADFYFAKPESTAENSGELTTLKTVNTIDNNEFGITMNMIDFNNAKKKFGTDGAQRDSVQTEFFGFADTQKLDLDDDGILSSYIENGENYPKTTTKTPEVQSLGNLFTRNDSNNKLKKNVNHLFLESTYNESGYFEYDSTQNFAHLNEDGNFVVYDALGAIGNSLTKKTRVHGQFMPYNELDPKRMTNYVNLTDELTNELSDLNPRKEETLYLINQNDADYFFGMELNADFYQTPDGLDDWGHDIIFEFSGDDDFWLYVDDCLVLDLGGVHQAMSGKVNFRTGEIERRATKHDGGDATKPDCRKSGWFDDTNPTIYKAFKKSYEDRGMTEAQVEAKLSEVFTQKEDGSYVFKDYSLHKMRVYYMERGASASNLHMRFNIAAAKKNTVVLSKKIEGTESQDYKLASYPFQIYYKTEEDSEEYKLVGDSHNPDACSVKIAGKNTDVRHEPTYTPAGSTKAYDSVYFLQPNQSAEIALPEQTVDYYIVECGISDSIYSKVEANGIELTGVGTTSGRSDYKTGSASIADRPRVEYVNHVEKDALRTLTITKKLFDAGDLTGGDISEARDKTGITYPEDTATFSYRLYLSDESGDLELAYMYKYHVKNVDGEYCKWIPEVTLEEGKAEGHFDSLHKQNYEELSEDEKREATFDASINGAITKIPAGFTVEVVDLLVGTRFKVIERKDEVPAGYRCLGYLREEGTYIEGEAPNSGIVRDSEDPRIIVVNQRGWGLSARKHWSDESYVEERDPIYLAVYIKDNAGNLSLVEGTIHQLKTGVKSTYWYFDTLQVGKTFSDYVVREVRINKTDPVIRDDGTVEDAKVEKILEGGNGENAPQVTLDGKMKTDEETKRYTYDVSYETGTPTGSIGNVRTDDVYNTRLGLRLRKTDMNGNPLEGATFTLKVKGGENAGASEYVSDATGVITIAYLADGEYELKEESAPQGYQRLQQPLSFSVHGGNVTVSNADEGMYEPPTKDSAGILTITVKNRPYRVNIMKTDGNGKALVGARFSLSRGVVSSSGTTMSDYVPIPGYDNLITDKDGLIVSDLQELGTGTYYLKETKAPAEYEQLEYEICIVISPDGEVSVTNNEKDITISRDINQDETIIYNISVENIRSMQWVSFKKVDIANPQGSQLEGAVFNLYSSEKVDGEELVIYEGMKSGADGILAKDNETKFSLTPGTYYLREIEAPKGYVVKDSDVIITVDPYDVFYDEGTSLSNDGGKTERNNVYELLISNSTGAELPSTGGIGTRAFTIVGATLVISSLAYGARLWLKMKMS